ncbi:MAG: histidine--tRNA ligase [Saprospiraceae bacterium]|nr:MAG: histidine--tRNA ligase [Saprospiraceae bacterium]GIV32315.1 MAG: histidine--tRNA ligase [Saprospiraceae bacterium]
MQRGIIPRKIKGFRDIDADLNALRSHIIAKASEVYRKYGFEHWDTPVLEYADVLGKYMPDTDSAEQGVYAFRNPEAEPVLLEDGTEMRDAEGRVIMDNHLLALRYDLTAPLARLYAERLWMDFRRNQVQEGRSPLFRRYQYGPVFRYEVKLLPGRFREFWQLDFDTVGSDDVATDAEACMILSDALEAIGLPADSYVVRVNNRKVLKGFLLGAGVEDEQTEQNILRIIDKLDKIGWDDVLAELGPGRTDKSGAEVPGLHLPPSLIDRIAAFLQVAGGLTGREQVLEKLGGVAGDHPLAVEGLEELQKMNHIWNTLGYDDSRIVFDPTLMRGMAYYTGPVFEAESLMKYTDERGRERKVGSICGGGRYDGLVERLLGMKVPATGASIGVDRLAEVLRMAMPDLARATGPVLIAWFDDELQDEYFRMAREIRQAGIPAEVYFGCYKGFRKIKKQMAYADQKNCPAVVLYGGDEAAKGVVSVKNLWLGKELSATVSDKQEWNRLVQQEVPRDRLVEHLRSLLEK